jgi:hypothetical protein
MAAESLQYEILISSYTSSSQEEIRRDISAKTEEGLKAMQKEAKDTDFSVEKIVYEDRMAYVRVRRKRGRATDIEVLRMIKEGDHWKLLP